MGMKDMVRRAITNAGRASRRGGTRKVGDGD
jgi:hypothetical protein